MATVLIDATPGNLHSAQKAFEAMAAETNTGAIVVTSEPEVVAKADRVVLPGDGAFPAVMSALTDRPALLDALGVAVNDRGVPFFGICVGMQLLASLGEEFRDTKGLDWVPGRVVPITPGDPDLKVPHMGWNDLVVDVPHAVLSGISTGDHAYFVHSFRMDVADPAHLIAHVDYGGPVTAIIGRDNLIGTQFHPEKSQSAGLRMIANFLTWTP
ncbi:MAG: imidazole glycerol phosphate synthase subunit HisH [Pseudomonadota bacterium]